MLLGILTAALCGCGSGIGTPVGVTSKAAPNGPQLGYAWRASDRTLRPIMGVPGGAQFGTSVVDAGTYVLGAASPTGSVALLVATDGAVYRMQVPDGVATPVGFTLGAGAQIEFSPTGAAALLSSTSSAAAALLTGLSTTVDGSAAPGVQPLTLPAGAKTVAVSDAGAVAVAMSSSGGVSVGLLDKTGGSRTLATLQQLGGGSFVPGTDDLLLTDSGANTLIRVGAASTNPALATLPSSGLLSAPGAVRASASGQWAVVANGGNANVVRVNLAGTALPQALACACQPATVAPLAGGNAFRVTALETGPVWIANFSAPQPKMMFIPALQAASTAPAPGEALP